MEITQEVNCRINILTVPRKFSFENFFLIKIPSLQLDVKNVLNITNVVALHTFIHAKFSWNITVVLTLATANELQLRCH
jgi:hypothetical protein